MSMIPSPETRAVTLLCLLARRLDAAGWSGRMQESEMLTLALALLPAPDPSDLPETIGAAEDARILRETRAYLHDQRSRRACS